MARPPVTCQSIVEILKRHLAVQTTEKELINVFKSFKHKRFYVKNLLMQ